MGKKTPKSSPKKSTPTKITNEVTDKLKTLTIKKEELAQSSSQSKVVNYTEQDEFGEVKTKKRFCKLFKKIEDLNSNDENGWDTEGEIKELLDMLLCPLFVGEDEKASATFVILEGILNEDKAWKTVRDLMNRIMNLATEIAAKVPHESTARNIILRFRRMILDEYFAAIREFTPPVREDTPENFRLVVAKCQDVTGLDLPPMPAGVDEDEINAKVKKNLIDVTMEFRMELENVPELIGSRGKDLIKDGDIVLTFAFCPLTALLLKEASRSCRFTLYVVESQPLCYGYLVLDELEGIANIKLVMVADASVGPMLRSVVTKVIIPATTVLADGNFKTLAFGATIAAYASQQSKPVYVVAATYQFSNSFVPFVNQVISPDLITETKLPNVEYFEQKFAETSAKYVTMLVTNNGCLAPNHISRVQAELYGSQYTRDLHKKIKRIGS